MFQELSLSPAIRQALIYMVIVSVLPGITYAGELYDRKLIKSRAERGYTNNGTVQYYYSEIDDYSDELNPEEELGAFEAEPGARKVHSRVIINGEVNSELEDLRIGTISSGRGGSLRSVDNGVTINGGVSVSGGENVSIGTIEINNRIRGASTMKNRVDIDGSLESE